MADQRLRQSNMGDQLRDAGLAVSKSPDNPQAIDVGQGLVEGPEFAQVLGLEDDRSNGRAEMRWGGGQSGTPIGQEFASYQRRFISIYVDATVDVKP